MKVEIGKKYRTKRGDDVRIICVDRNGDYSVVGLLGKSENVEAWTIDGKYQVYADTSYDLVEVSQFDDFKVDEPVLVRDHRGDEWEKRHFAKVSESGNAMTYPAGTTSWTVSDEFLIEWDYCIRPNQEVKES